MHSSEEVLYTPMLSVGVDATFTRSGVEGQRTQLGCDVRTPVPLGTPETMSDVCEQSRTAQTGVCAKEASGLSAACGTKPKDRAQMGQSSRPLAVWEEA